VGVPRARPAQCWGSPFMPADTEAPFLGSRELNRRQLGWMFYLAAGWLNLRAVPHGNTRRSDTWRRGSACTSLFLISSGGTCSTWAPHRALVCNACAARSRVGKVPYARRGMTVRRRSGVPSHPQVGRVCHALQACGLRVSHPRGQCSTASRMSGLPGTRGTRGKVRYGLVYRSGRHGGRRSSPATSRARPTGTARFVRPAARGHCDHTRPRQSPGRLTNCRSFHGGRLEPERPSTSRAAARDTRSTA
jgi:hypothetical protein